MHQTGQPIDMSVEQKRAFRKKAGLWAQSNALPRLILLMQMMSIIRPLQHKFFHLASAKFDRDQRVKRSKGLPRTYRVLAVAEGTYLQQAFQTICNCFCTHPAAFPLTARNLKHRSLAFRLLSRCGSALHQLMRSFHRGYPYRLFTLLKDPTRRLDGDEDHACFWDELTTGFFEHFKGQETSEEAQVCLASMAEAIHIDIAGMEARHAVTRRATTLKSLQTWVASLESINVTWSVGQCQRAYATKDGFRTASTQTQKKRKTDKKQEKRPGGGGGAFRAFIHENYGGVRLDGPKMKAIAQEYHSLAAERRDYYKELGKLGTMAWRQNKGHRQAAFGKPLPKQTTTPEDAPSTDPVVVLPSGAVVAMANNHDRQIIPSVACKFEKGIKAIVSESRFYAKQVRARLEEEDDLLQQQTIQTLAKCPTLVKGTKSSDMFEAASSLSSQEIAPLPLNEFSWTPRSAEFAAASLLKFSYFSEIFHILPLLGSDW